MPFSLTYGDLPLEIGQWPALPLSLSGDEIMPLDYRAGHTGWLLYGRELNKSSLTKFQRRLQLPLVVVAAWLIEDYQVVRLAGIIPKKAKKIADEYGFDIAQITDNIPNLTSPGLLVMDMDSTAIQIECIDEIAKLAGVGELVASITDRAMRGELDFSASLRKRVAALKGTNAEVLQQVLDNLPLTPGLETLVQNLKERGWYIAIISGGFTFFADHLCEKLKLNASIANELDIKQNKLTGKIQGAIVDAKFKAGSLLSLAENLDIPISQTVAVGDGANDLKMIQAAGMGIAFHAKPKVYTKAKQGIRHADLMGVLCILSVGLYSKGR